MCVCVCVCVYVSVGGGGGLIMDYGGRLRPKRNLFHAGST